MSGDEEIKKISKGIRATADPASDDVVSDESNRVIEDQDQAPDPALEETAAGDEAPGSDGYGDEPSPPWEDPDQIPDPTLDGMADDDEAPSPDDYAGEEPPLWEDPDQAPDPALEDMGFAEEAPRPDDDDGEPQPWDEQDQAPDPALEGLEAGEDVPEAEAEPASASPGKMSYAAISRKRINRGQKFQRTKTMAIILGIIFILMFIFVFGSNMRKKQETATDMGKAGKVYIPEMVRREGDRTSVETEIPPDVYAYDPRNDDEILKDLDKKREDEHVAPVPQEPVRQTSQGGYAAPSTNRNPLQKAVTRMPWNGSGQTTQAQDNGASPSPFGQMPTPEQYIAQLQQRGAALGTQTGGMYGGQAAGMPNSYSAQNMQSDKERFAGAGSGTAGGYQWNSEYSLWRGTIIPAVLETGLNSDLPGAVIARVTRNVYSSLDGKYLLIPEGSRLYATYNSNISYSQRRVQIAWSTLIRPDGLEITLGNMQGVDLQGYTGAKGWVDEHFFEYLKAMGIISVFSIANGELDNSLQQLNSSPYTDQIISENRNVINQLGGKLIDRALDIQPTVRVRPGTEVNVLTNMTIELPPLEPYPVTQKYERR
ncbi:hypothetical protein FACS189473_2020 [Spirochaetia bacterium]|nr:hypothetical protein FACS189473_2020 [Spirochaetia bacterium]